MNAQPLSILRRGAAIAVAVGAATFAAVTIAPAARGAPLSPIADGQWLGVPPQTMAGSAAYDSSRDRALVVGSATTACVWQVPLAPPQQPVPVWTTGEGPPYLEHQDPVYDPARDQLIVFGPTTGSGGPGGLVWVLDLSATTPTWQPVVPAGGGPRARYGGVTVLDAPHDRLLVFGGYAYPDFLGDAWAFDLATRTWSPILPAGTGPGARIWVAGIYDPVRDRLVVNGGWMKDAADYCDDVWALQLGASPAWTRLDSAGTGSSAYAYHRDVYDPTGDRMLVFGGANSGGTPHAEVRAFSLASDTWSLETAAGDPPGGRIWAGALRDPRRDRVVLFSNGVWSWTANADPPWSQLSAPAPEPAARVGHTALFDPERGRALVFGGRITTYVHYDFTTTYYDDLWCFDLHGSPYWSPLATAGPPPSVRQFPGAALDPAGEAVWLFGGSLIYPQYSPHLPSHMHTSFYGDLWKLDLSVPTWSQPAAIGPAPGPRDGHAFVLDPVRRRLLLFGGRDSLGVRGDLWSLALDGTPQWSELHPSGEGPGPRMWPVAVFDSVRDRVLIFGGQDADSLSVSDAWALSMDDPPVWSALATSGSAPATHGPRPWVHDRSGDRIRVFGTGQPSYDPGLEVRQLDLGTLEWTTLAPSGHVPDKVWGSAAWHDPRSGGDLLVWGAQDFTGTGPSRRVDLLLFDSDIATPVEVALVECSATPERVRLRWSTAGAGLTQCTIERREVDGAWVTLSAAVPDGTGMIVYEDAGVRPGGRYFYRLSWMEAGTSRAGPETLVEVPVLAFGLDPLRPNPAARAFTVSIRLADGAPARVEVLDLAGRRVGVRRLEAPVPGATTLSLATDGFPPGVYVVRLVQGGRAVQRRLCVLR